MTNQLNNKIDSNILSYQFFKELTTIPVVEAIYLYGSRARGTHSARSDIDLAIVCPTADVRQWQQVQDIIDRADTLLAIDCLRFDQESPTSRLRQNIERDKQVIYQRTNR